MSEEIILSTKNLHVMKESKDVRMKENHVVITCREIASDEDCVKETQKTDLVSAQELAARTINPMKLIMLLRTRFGLGHYEISRMPNVYNIRTPSYLSGEEIARCKWD